MKNLSNDPRMQLGSSWVIEESFGEHELRPNRRPMYERKILQMILACNALSPKYTLRLTLLAAITVKIGLDECRGKMIGNKNETVS